MNSPDRIDWNRVADIAVSVVKHRKESIDAPATPSKLESVWTAWHNLPMSLTADEKAAILLMGDKQALGHLLPFGFSKFPLDYFRAIEAAKSWAKMIERLRSAETELQQRTESHWQWVRPVLQDVDRIGLVRAARELRLTQPGLIDNQNPSLEHIEVFRSRQREYIEARQRGLDRAKELLDSLVPHGTPVQFSKRAPLVWSERPDMLKAYCIAAMRALNLCPDEMWRQWKGGGGNLNQNEKRRFDFIVNKGALRKNSIEAFKLWLIDNGPLIESHDLRPGELYDCAKELGIQVPSSRSAAIKETSAWERGFSFGRGPRIEEVDRRAKKILKLLSPRPRLSMTAET